MNKQEAETVCVFMNAVHPDSWKVYEHDYFGGRFDVGLEEYDLGSPIFETPQQAGEWLVENLQNDLDEHEKLNGEAS